MRYIKNVVSVVGITLFFHFDGLSHAALVLVGMSRVDVPVTGLQGGQHRVVSHLPSRNAIHAEAELGNLHPIIQCQIRLILLCHNCYTHHCQ